MTTFICTTEHSARPIDLGEVMALLDVHHHDDYLGFKNSMMALWQGDRVEVVIFGRSLFLEKGI